MSSDLVLTESIDRVVKIQLNRPEKNNAVNFAMLDQLEHVVDDVARADDVVAVVVSGGGTRGFCGGADEGLATGRDQGLSSFIRRFWHLCWRLANLNPPVITAINGNCFAAGIALALSSDLRVAVEGIKFSIPAAGRGAPLCTHVLPFHTSDCWAKEILLLGRPVDAENLYRMGMLNRVVPREELWPTVEGFVDQFRQMSITGIRTAKTLLNRAPLAGPAAAMVAELAVTEGLLEGPEFKANVNLAVDARRSQVSHLP